jgi:predicted transcriptional regulator
MDDKPLYKDEQWLEEKYWDEGLTQAEMASLEGVVKGTISKYMRKFDIPRRSSAESRHFREEGPHDDADWLNEMYHSESFTIPQIAEKADVTPGTIHNRMREFGIPTRVRGKQVSGDREKLKNENWLRQRYIEDGMSVNEIAEELDLSLTPVRRYMIKYGINFRGTSEANKLRHTPKGSKLRDEDWMRQKYLDEGWSTVKIANAAETTPATAQRWLENHGIVIRPLAESASIAKTESHIPELYDEEYMRREYVEKGKNTPEIADDLGVTGTPVRNSLQRYGIELRSAGESLADGNVTPLLDYDWLRQQYVVRQRTIYDIGDELEVAPSTVSGHLENHGFERRGGAYRPQNFSHKVRSEWEHEIANQLIQYGVQYKYEPKDYVVNYNDGARYTPDFVTDKFIIEVKGFEREGGNEAEKAKAAMEEYSEMEYVVIGAYLPCDHHFSFDDRHELRRLFE